MHEAKGRILGYRVDYTPKTDSGGRSQNVTFDNTQLRRELSVREQEGEVTVTASNSAGSSPPSLLRIHPLPPQGEFASPLRPAVFGHWAGLSPMR